MDIEENRLGLLKTILSSEQSYYDYGHLLIDFEKPSVEPLMLLLIKMNEQPVRS